MTGHAFLFTVFALATCLSAIAVVVSQAVVRMAFWLIISLGSTAALFFLADADFVGAAQLLIYVGGTLVLLVFGVMLTASGPYLKIATSPGETILAALLGLMFLMIVFGSIQAVDWTGGDPAVNSGQQDGTRSVNPGNTLRPIGLSLLGLRVDGAPDGDGAVGAPGYLLPFEIVSVHLLVVLIGSAYLARAKRSRQSAGGNVSVA